VVAERHYQEPGWFTRHVFNATVGLITRLGLSVWGSRVLAGADSADADLQRIAPRHPVFKLSLGKDS
jgi:hypothetical protein